MAYINYNSKDFNPTFCIKMLCKLGFICQQIVTYKPDKINLKVYLLLPKELLGKYKYI